MMLNKKTFLAVGICIAASACGRAPEVSQFMAGEPSTIPVWQFSAADAEAILSSAVEVRDGQKWPVSKPFISAHYAGDKIPAPLVEYLWPFADRDVSVAFTEKGFLHLGAPISANYEKSMIGSFESLSKWTEIQAPYGDNVYTDAFTIDGSGNRIEDKVDGQIAGTSETVHGRVKFNSPNVAVPMVLDVVMNKTADGALHIRIHNTKNVSVFPLGNIINEKKMQIVLDMYPYGNGWLMYTGALLKLEKFENAEIGPKIISWIVEGTVDWLKLRVVQPLPG